MNRIGDPQPVLKVAQQLDDRGAGRGARAEVGSSSTTSAGSVAMARAMPTRCNWAPH